MSYRQRLPVCVYQVGGVGRIALLVGQCGGRCEHDYDRHNNNEDDTLLIIVITCPCCVV
jgi:hypothetical protein